MKIMGAILAVAMHASFILFGGALVGQDAERKLDANTTTAAVDLTGADVAKKDKKDQAAQEVKDEVKKEDETPPDPEKLVDNEPKSAAVGQLKLEALDLSQLTAAASGLKGGGDFGVGGSLGPSGGVIGGTESKAQTLEQKFEKAFNPNEIDQKPTVTFKTVPSYPPEMRDSKTDGEVTVLFIVDETGKVQNQRVQRSSHPAFEGPALTAVRQWKFNPGLKSGQPVACKMRVTIKFPRVS